MAELADALDLGSSVNDVGVQVSSGAPPKTLIGFSYKCFALNRLKLYAPSCSNSLLTIKYFFTIILVLEDRIMLHMVSNFACIFQKKNITLY